MVESDSCCAATTDHIGQLNTRIEWNSTSGIGKSIDIRVNRSLRRIVAIRLNTTLRRIRRT